MTFTRRNALQLGAAGAAIVAAPQLGHAQPVSTPQPSLNQIAASKGMRFGSATAAVGGGSIQNPDYAAILVGECGLLVPENEMKMYAVRPTPDRFDFARADAIMAFADQHGLAVRGHNL